MFSTTTTTTTLSYSFPDLTKQCLWSRKTSTLPQARLGIDCGAPECNSQETCTETQTLWVSQSSSDLSTNSHYEEMTTGCVWQNTITNGEICRVDSSKASEEGCLYALSELDNLVNMPIHDSFNEPYYDKAGVYQGYRHRVCNSYLCNSKAVCTKPSINREGGCMWNSVASPEEYFYHQVHAEIVTAGRMLYIFPERTEAHCTGYEIVE